MALGLAGLFLTPYRAVANDTEPEALRWARIDFLRNRVQLLPSADQARRAQISDILRIGDSLRTMRRSRAELRFNDDSLARIGERATFQFTPNTRNFQLTNGTVLLLIPPGKGRSTIQTPNAVTGIQGSALFVRYIPETDTTIVGALTDNPNGPMVLFNRDGTEQQALRANEVGVIEGDQITELYRFDSQLFWESSGLAEGLDISGESSDSDDPLAGVHQEIREAIAKRDPLPSNGAGVVENPSSFSRPDENAPASDPGDGLETPSSDGSQSAAPTNSNETEDTGNADSESADSEATDSVDPQETTGAEATDSEASAAPSGTPTAEAGVNDASEPSTENSAVEQPTDDVLEPVPGASPTIEPTEETSLAEELAEVEEPVMELEFEGTPAETYLSAPLTASPEQPGDNSGSRLVPTTNLDPNLEEGEPASTGDEPDVEFSPEGEEEVPTPLVDDSVVLPTDDLAIPDGPIDNGGRPLTERPKDPNIVDDSGDSTDDSPVDDSPVDQAPDLNEPRAPEPVLTTTPEDPPVESPTEQQPTEEQPVEQPTDEAPPILLESEPAPEVAEPATPPSTPVIDPSTTLIPVELEEAPSGSDVPLDEGGVQPETQPELILEQPETSEEPDPEPVQVTDPVVEVEPSLEAPEPVVEVEPNSDLQTPGEVIESVDTPDEILPESVPTVETFEDEVPFDEPEVGGASLDETLDPVELPEQVTDDAGPRSLTEGGNNGPEDTNPEVQSPEPQSPEPVTETPPVLL